MATLRQIEANRRNALKSTGPRSAAGKAVSCFNALQTGIDAKSLVIRGEDQCALEQLAGEYHERFRPATPDARFLVDSLVNAEWQLRRLRKVEAQLWDYPVLAGQVAPGDLALATTFVRSVDIFTRLQRRIDSAERVYRRALERLNRLESEPADDGAFGAPPESEAPATEPPALLPAQRPGPKIGFVPDSVQIVAQRPIGFVPSWNIDPGCPSGTARQGARY